MHKRKLRGFLGVVGYCRNWVPNYSSLTAPLNELTTDAVKEPFIHSDITKYCFEQSKYELLMAPALGIPNYELSFTLVLP